VLSTVSIEIPANATGDLSILVTDGRHLNTLEQRELRRTLQPQSVAQLMRALNEVRRNNRIYVRLLTGTPGAVVKAEAMTALPPSVLSVMESDRNGGSFSPIRSATIGEWEVVMDSAISGSRLPTIDLDSGREAPPPAPFLFTVPMMRTWLSEGARARARLNPRRPRASWRAALGLGAAAGMTAVLWAG